MIAGKLTAGKFTNVGTGVIAANKLVPDVYEELIDLAVDRSDKVVKKFQDEMPGFIMSAIAEWFSLNQPEIVDPITPSAMNEVLMQCSFEDVVDGIVEQLGGELRGIEQDRCIFTPENNRHTYIGLCCSSSSNSVDAGIADLSNKGYISDAVTKVSDVTDDPFGRLEVIVVGDAVDSTVHASQPTVHASQPTVHVICSPYIANRKLRSGTLPPTRDVQAQYDLEALDLDGDLCYTLPPWFFLDKNLLAFTSVITSYPTLLGRHLKYIDYIVSLMKSEGRPE